ncbi:MAG TPA: SdrD B-like domain-containing protein [Candidatus Krumholzibacteria bacterium]|nr:SdrD B-like domain-containing protein [Candidatus Krumholzibacteria bacterium]
MRTWNRPPLIAVVLAVVAALAGCTQRESPELMSPGSTQFSEAVAPYTLAFISRAYDSETNQTTFQYQLQNATAPGSPATGVLAVLTNVMVELPACAPAPASFLPPDGASVLDDNGIHGVEWGVGYDDNPGLYYSVVFPGDVPAGTVRGMVTRGGLHFVQSLAGPCEGTFSISGVVFVDTDGDGVQNANELGVDNVTVALRDGETTRTVKTASDGDYVFTTGAGNYTVAVDSVTADNTDFNEVLYDGWNPTSPTYVSVTVGPNSTGNSFAFEPDVAHVVAQIGDNGAYPTNGKTYQWWRSQINHALHHGGHDDDDLLLGEHPHHDWYTADELVGFIHQIQALALPSQYHFTPGHELQQAYQILNNHACSDEDDDDDDTFGDGDQTVARNHLDGDEDGHGHHDPPTCDAYKVLQRELLTTEFNHVTGRGLYTNLPLQYNLIEWGEGVLQGNQPSGGGDDFRAGGGPQRALTNPVEGGGVIFKKVNGATGGGGVGG